MTKNPAAFARPSTRPLPIRLRVGPLLLAGLGVMTQGPLLAQALGGGGDGALPGLQERRAALADLSARMSAILMRAGIDVSQPEKMDFGRLSAADQAELQVLRDRMARLADATTAAPAVVASPMLPPPLNLPNVPTPFSMSSLAPDAKAVGRAELSSPALAAPTAAPGTSRWAVPAFPPVPLAAASNAAWLDAVAGPPSLSPGVASFGEMRFEGEMSNGRPAGRGVLRMGDGMLTYEGRVQGTSQGGKTTAWVFTSPVLRTWVPPATGRFGAQDVLVTRGARNTSVFLAPAPEALSQAAKQPLPCARPATVPAHWVAWQFQCMEGQVDGALLFFSPDLRHSFQGVARLGRLVAGSLNVDQGNKIWDATEWGDGLQPSGIGRLVARLPVDADPHGNLDEVPSPPAELVFEGRFANGLPNGPGVCGAQRNECTFMAGVLLPGPVAAARPPRPEWAQVDAWVHTFTSPGWKADDEIELDRKGKRADMFDLWSSALSVGGCTRESNMSVTVEDGGVLPGGIKSYRGDWSRCGPQGVGDLRYANGDRYIGQVGNLSRPTQPLPQEVGVGLLIKRSGEQHLVMRDGRLRNLVRLSPGEGWWAQGDFDGRWNASDGEFTLPDGSSFRGRLEDARPAGKGLWRNASNTVRILGEASLNGQELRFTGEVEVSLEVPMGDPMHPRRRPGRYLALAGSSSTAAQLLQRLDRLLPTPESLPSLPVAECLGKLALPPGWRADGGLCVPLGWSAPPLVAYSPELRWRLVARPGLVTAGSAFALPDAWDRLEELNTGSTGAVARTWRSAMMDASQWPVLMTGEVRYTDPSQSVDYTGPVEAVTMLPDGDGRCAQPRNEGRGDEPCQFAAGKRVDDLHVLRQERLALERERREVAERVGEERRRVEQEDRRRQQQAREAEEERIAQARGRAQREEDDRNTHNAIVSALGSVQQSFQKSAREMQESNRRTQAVIAQANEAARAAQRAEEERRASRLAEQQRAQRQTMANAERQRRASDAELQRRLDDLRRRQEEARVRMEQQARERQEKDLARQEQVARQQSEDRARQQAEQQVRQQAENRAHQPTSVAQASTRTAEPSRGGAGNAKQCFELFSLAAAESLKYDKCVSDRRTAQGDRETVKSLREGERQCMDKHRPLIDAARQRQRDAGCTGTVKAGSGSRQ